MPGITHKGKGADGGIASSQGEEPGGPARATPDLVPIAEHRVGPARRVEEKHVAWRGHVASPREAVWMPAKQVAVADQLPPTPNFGHERGRHRRMQHGHIELVTNLSEARDAKAKVEILSMCEGEYIAKAADLFDRGASVGHVACKKAAWGRGADAVEMERIVRR